MSTEAGRGEAERIVCVESGGESSCPGCSHNVVSRYRLGSEADEEAVCGDCFSSWLVAIEASVSP